MQDSHVAEWSSYDRTGRVGARPDRPIEGEGGDRRRPRLLPPSGRDLDRAARGEVPTGSSCTGSTRGLRWSKGRPELDGTRIVLERKAAWVEDGELEFARVPGLRGWDSTVMRAKNAKGEWGACAEVILVPCFDFSSWLRALHEPTIVKLDVEGAEFPILEKLAADGTDALVAELLVEWHDDRMPGHAGRKETLLAALRCPVTPWEDAKTTVASTIRGLWKSRRAIGARR